MERVRERERGEGREEKMSVVIFSSFFFSNSMPRYHHRNSYKGVSEKIYKVLLKLTSANSGSSCEDLADGDGILE